MKNKTNFLTRDITTDARHPWVGKTYKIKVVELNTGCDVTVYINNKKANKQYDYYISKYDLESVLRRDFDFIRENRYHMEYNGKKTYYYIEDKDKLSNTFSTETATNSDNPLSDIAYIVVITYYYASYKIKLTNYKETIFSKEKLANKQIPDIDVAKQNNSFYDVSLTVDEYNRIVLDLIAKYGEACYYDKRKDNWGSTNTTIETYMLRNSEISEEYELTGTFVNNYVGKYIAYNNQNEIIKSEISSDYDIEKILTNFFNYNDSFEYDFYNSCNDYTLYVNKDYIKTDNSEDNNI